MAEAVDPNLVKMSTANFGWVQDGIKDGMQYAQAKSELEFKRDNLEQQRQQTEQQRALLNFQKQAMIVDDLKEVLDQPPGQYRKAMQKKFQLKAQTIGLNVSPEYMALLDDEEGQKSATEAIKRFDMMTPTQRATTGYAELSAWIGSENAKKHADQLASMTKAEQQAAKEQAELDLKGRAQDTSETETSANIQNKKDTLALDKQKAQWEHQYQMGLLAKQKRENLNPVANKFADPIQKLEQTFDTNQQSLTSALANFKAHPSSATKQQLAVSIARYGKDTGVLSDRDVGAYNLRSIGSDARSVMNYLTNSPENVDNATFNGLNRLAGDLLLRGKKAKVQAVGKLFETRLNADPELMNYEGGKKHPIIQRYENQLGVEAVQTPEGLIKLQPSAKAKAIQKNLDSKTAVDPKDVVRQQAISILVNAGKDLGTINKAIGKKGFKGATQNEIDALRAGNRQPQSAEDLMARNTELTQGAIGNAQSAQIDDSNVKPVSAPDTIDEVPSEDQSTDLSGQIQDLDRAPSRNPSSSDDLEVVPVTPVVEPGQIPVDSQDLKIVGQKIPGNVKLEERLAPKSGKGKAPAKPFMTANVNGRQVVIPLINDMGRVMSEEEALDEFLKTGQHLGVFKDPQSAEKFIGKYAKKDKKKGK